MFQPSHLELASLQAVPNLTAGLARDCQSDTHAHASRSCMFKQQTYKSMR
jgi:hypothetical protein